ncbi:hypothetical protein TNCV_2389481 [Trichonephila clavipes]|nr:hypothetical protein TNCV_2389481 [Trichonephila clavipes]
MLKVLTKKLFINITLKSKTWATGQGPSNFDSRSTEDDTATGTPLSKLLLHINARTVNLKIYCSSPSVYGKGSLEVESRTRQESPGSSSRCCSHR